MTSRDLIQQRTTLPNGDTIWQNSPLVTAALEGKMAVLDGIHRIHASTLAVIHRYCICYKPKGNRDSHIWLKLCIIRKTLKGRKQTNKYGRGTERHLPKTHESIVWPAGERHLQGECMVTESPIFF